jgi:hypothetical protein
MKKIICKFFGHNWKYFFTSSDYYSERTDVRICKCCGKTQQYKKISTLSEPEPKSIWMNMIGFTKFGANKYWNNK